MEKIKYELKASVETITVLPRTLEIKPEQMKLPGAEATMHVVYGYDPAQRKVWCATFIDEQEAGAWVHGSKVFGRPVRGAVVAGQENVKLVEAGGEMSDGAVAVGDEGSGPAGKPS
jgi:hypothetical protein